MGLVNDYWPGVSLFMGFDVLLFNKSDPVVIVLVLLALDEIMLHVRSHKLLAFTFAKHLREVLRDCEVC